ncbi:MAG TPA: FAD-linked oxidase C-terminal domain-containing protein [Polyangia bacterium]|jgi:FAD/FMN-containing dehydrogenase/Fe-S oxidoreductase|nr:FAD-linked oxidase C-terminal domain-containing protein [Polyangia bacterium]
MAHGDLVPIRTSSARARRREPVPASVDAKALAAELEAKLDGEVRFDDGSRALYATDGSNYRQLPIGVVIPRHKVDVMTTVEVCAAHGAPLLSRGGGTSLAGQCCNVAVVMDMSKYFHGVLELDLEGRRARVLPGTVLDTLRDAAKKHDLTFGPDPATHNHCTLGGMIGNNSCGVHAVMAGRTADNVHELEILTYDGALMRVGPTPPEELEAIISTGGRRGQIYRDLKALIDRYGDLVRARYPKIPRRVSGFNLDELLPENGFNVARALVGTEGTCVTVLEATLRLVPWPRYRTLVVLGYGDIAEAAAHAPAVMSHGPIGCEAIDRRLIANIHKKGLHEKYLRYLPEGDSFLLAEFGGDTKEEADERARTALHAPDVGAAPPRGKLYDDLEQEERIWELRESGLGATARVPGEPDTWPGWEDSAVPPERMADYLRDLRKIYDQHGLQGAFYGHFGQGCLHTRITFDLESARGLENFRSFMNDASDLCVRYGGSLSGEHGDGQSRAELLPKMFGPELVKAFREFKAIWDPSGRMNPGKVVDPYPIDANLRLGAGYEPRPVTTHFAYPDDEGSFTRATLRCVGVGKCRREGSGTMCPSYMATREEQHATRGRAHLLFEMMRGQELDGWRDDAVRESLDLCLACKGCKGECPVNVDVATYKAEFLSHHYENRLRPLAAYSMGLIHWWARLASIAPGLVNTFTQTPLTGKLLKRLGGIAPERRIPVFAARTFKAEWRRRPPRNAGAPEVMLWPDTFNDHFFPETAMAAAEVLEAAGFHVIVPEQDVCCGRPLYDFGMLATAKRLLRSTLDRLREPIDRGVPIVGLEPSCVSVFRDEMHSLMPQDPLAERMRAQTYLFSEFLAERAKGVALPQLQRRAVVHGHCHHKSLFGMSDEKEVLERLGLDFEVLDTGCCGMAGSFGFERGDKYEVSVKIAEQRLYPAVRGTDDETLLVADGFSCREQIRQGTSRQALHVAEVAHAALHAGARPLSQTRPERDVARSADRYPVLSPVLPAAAAALALGTAGAALALRARRDRLGTAARALTRPAGLVPLLATGVVASALAALGVAARRQRRRQAGA